MPVQMMSLKQQEGVGKLVEAMKAKGLNITDAVVGMPRQPGELNGVRPHVLGKAGNLPALGHVVLVEEITREPIKADLHHLTTWATEHDARRVLGVIGRPSKGFHGLEQEIQIESMVTAGWEIIHI